MKLRMEARSPEGPEEFRDAMIVNQRAWQTAYEGIIDEEVLTNLDFVNGSDESVTERFENRVDAPDRLIRVVVEDGKVVATGSVIWGDAMKPFADESDVELRTIYVDPTRWGEGIGTILLDSLLADVPSDVDRLVLETLVGNEVGISFYRSRGFDSVGEHEFTVDDMTYPTIVFARLLS